jgi:hypothetical protein
LSPHEQAIIRVGFMAGMAIGPSLFSLSLDVGFYPLFYLGFTAFSVAALVLGYRVRVVDGWRKDEASRDATSRSSAADETTPLLK